MESKAELRKAALTERKNLSSAQYHLLNQSLCNQLLEFIRFHDYSSVHVFLPIQKNNEPDFTSLFPQLWKDGVKIMVSKTNFRTKTMSHFWLESETTSTINELEIPEPIGAISANLSDAELIVVPLLLGDKLGNRIGYGGGFYDRLLPDFKGQTIGISLAPLVNELPTDDWDVPLNSILFPK